MLEVVSGHARPRERFTRNERGGKDTCQSSPAEMQGRCFSRHGTTLDDYADAFDTVVNSGMSTH